MEKGRSTLSTRGTSLKSFGSRSVPVLWPFSSKPRDKCVTVHRMPVLSPGPKYNLQAPPIIKGLDGISRESQNTYTLKRDITFAKEERMKDGKTENDVT